MNKTRKRRSERLLPGVLNELDRWANRVETGLQNLSRPGPVLPADVGKRLLGAMLAPENILEDVRYFKIVPNDYVIELNEANYQRHYQPVEKLLYRQWRDKLLEALNTANSRQGRREYRFGGRVRLRLQPVADLAPEVIRLHCQINPDVDAVTPVAVTACLELWPAGRRWPHHDEITVLGRDEPCDICLDMPVIQQKRLISGRHAYIRQAGGQFRLYDGSPEGKASVNGTFVNGRRVPPAGHALQDGNVIILASLDPRQPSLDTPGVAGFITNLHLLSTIFYLCGGRRYHKGIISAVGGLFSGKQDMDVAWSPLLFAAKWLFVGLIYLSLFVVLVAVRREMHFRIANRLQTPVTGAAGRLKVLEAGSDPKTQRGALLPLPNEATLGAGAGNDLVLADRFVSGRHAQVWWDGVEWWVKDLGSKNGTLINGRPCPPQRQQPIPFGATLQIGDMVFELVE